MRVRPGGRWDFLQTIDNIFPISALARCNLCASESSHIHTMNRPSLLLLASLLIVSAATADTRVPASLQKKFPGLRVQAKVATKRDQVQGSWYMQSMTISPSVVVEGAPTQPQGAMEATMLIIAMDTRAKYTERREVYGVHAAETVPVPAVDKATKRE